VKGIGILGDLTFAILPIFLIWSLSRSVIERCLISFLMAMGLFALGAGVMMILYTYTYDRTSPDALREMMPVFLWCRTEEVVLIVSCSAPLLKAPVGSVLGRMGFPSFREQTRDLNSFHPSNFELPEKRLGAEVKEIAMEGPAPRRTHRIDLEKGEGGRLGSTAAPPTLDGQEDL
jgi:hypothetical protein